MTLLQLLDALMRADVITVALDPVAGKVRWQGGAVDGTLRAEMAAMKPALLALAGGAPLVATPATLSTTLPPGWRLIQCDHAGHPTSYGVYWQAIGPSGRHTDIQAYPDSAAFWAWRTVGDGDAQHHPALDV